MQDAAAAHVWHAIAAEAAIGALGADPLRGLDESEAAARHAQDGPNELPEANRRSLARIAFDQFNDFMILVLAAAAVVSGLVGGPQDAIAVVVIILINAFIGFFQEVRAENAIAALKAMAAPNALVRRNGETRAIPASDLVRGDIVIIEAGAVAPADLRLIETAGLACAEAALTGEAATVLKDVAAIVEPSARSGSAAPWR